MGFSRFLGTQPELQVDSSDAKHKKRHARGVRLVLPFPGASCDAREYGHTVDGIMLAHSQAQSLVTCTRLGKLNAAAAAMDLAAIRKTLQTVQLLGARR